MLSTPRTRLGKHDLIKKFWGKICPPQDNLNDEDKISLARLASQIMVLINELGDITQISTSLYDSLTNNETEEWPVGS